MTVLTAKNNLLTLLSLLFFISRGNVIVLLKGPVKKDLSVICKIFYSVSYMERPVCRAVTMLPQKMLHMNFLKHIKPGLKTHRCVV